jgi:formylglycine-generating enzyme required for sulfatase activity
MRVLARIALCSVTICFGGPTAIFPADKDEVVRVRLGDSEAVFCRIRPKAEGVDYPDFYMLDTEVTNRQYKQFLTDTKRNKDDMEVLEIVRQQEAKATENGILFLGSTGDIPYSVEDPTSIWKDNEHPKGQGEFPVCLVTLVDAKDFCKWLSSKNPTVGVFRLPTWNEWMVAAYGRDRHYPWGDKWDNSLVHMSYALKFSERPKRTQNVKARPKGSTPQGLFGMLGNAAELIDDSDPTSANYFNLKARWMGGGFQDGALSEVQRDKSPLEPRRDYWGYSHHATLRVCDVGFRVVLDPTKDPSLLKRPRLFKQRNTDWMIENK